MKFIEYHLTSRKIGKKAFSLKRSWSWSWSWSGAGAKSEWSWSGVGAVIFDSAGAGAELERHFLAWSGVGAERVISDWSWSGAGAQKGRSCPSLQWMVFERRIQMKVILILLFNLNGLI